MEDKFETLGNLIDSLDSLAHALETPFDPRLQVEQIKKALPKKVEALKKVFVEITGENPWE